jgi:hypothetical protein
MCAVARLCCTPFDHIIACWRRLRPLADQRVIGILSERDIMRAFAEFGANA